MGELELRNPHLSRTVADLRASLARLRQERARIGLVPTMGAFHEGHLSLMRQARHECDVVVVSLFVNPIQFNETGDLAAYPRNEQRDLTLAAQVGVDFVFAPSTTTIYPDGFATTVAVAGVTEALEGTHRGRGHFDGVTTVVAKLLNIVHPDVAYFGQKDAQQAVVIRRMAADLNFPVRIEVCPTVRAADGLALSSRNVRLSPEERGRATALHRSLSRARKLARDGEREAGAILAAARTELDAASIDPDYLELVDAETLAPVARLNGRTALAVVAARVGETRLIDNEPLGGD